MEKSNFTIYGGNHIDGEINISGAKNSALPIMIASILTDENVRIFNVPYLSDVVCLLELLKSLGVKVTFFNSNPYGDAQQEDISFLNKTDKLELVLNSSKIDNFFGHHSIVNKMRASFWILGPLLAKYGQAKVGLPGGCSIGERAIDMHIEVLRLMGCSIEVENGYIKAKSNGRLKGINFHFYKKSVGATINAIMSASLAYGESNFTNCSIEPEVVDLCYMLKDMGANINGMGTNNIKVIGKTELKGTKHKVIPDRIELGTYICAVGITKGMLKLKGITLEYIKSIKNIFESCGINLLEKEDSVIVSCKSEIYPVDIETSPYPGFPTDLQAQLMSLICLAKGTSRIRETIFDNRFMHVPELVKMGANIKINNNLATIFGPVKFIGGNVIATDLRASVCLVLAALATNRKTIINQIEHIDRGYNKIEEKLKNCGINIQRNFIKS